jgi:hypothetical protein
MALDSPEAYERLGEHLKEIDPIFQEFLRASGYSDNTGALGRYPHRSAVKKTDVSRKIDLYMEEDEETGQRFSTFDPSIPYFLWAGAWVDLDGKRYCLDRGGMIFEHLPFVEMVPNLSEYLRDAAAALESYSQAEIIAQSKPFELG